MTGFSIDLVSRRWDRLDAVACGRPGAVAAAWREGDPWSAAGSLPWSPIGGATVPAGEVSAVSRRPEVIDVVTIDPRGDLMTSWSWNDSWAHRGGRPWVLLGQGFPAGASAAIGSPRAECLVVAAVRRSGDAVATVWADGVWSHSEPTADGQTRGWTPLGQRFPPGAPLTAVSGPGTVDLFGIDRSGRVVTTQWREGIGWTRPGLTWNPLSDTHFHPGGRVAAAGSGIAGGRTIDVVAVTSGRYPLARRSVEGVGWEPWQSLGSRYFWVGTPMTMIARSPQVTDIVTVADGGEVLTAWRSGPTWSDWVSLGGRYPIGRVGVCARLPTVIDVVVRGPDRAWHSWWTRETGWSSLTAGWRELGSPGYP